MVKETFTEIAKRNAKIKELYDAKWAEQTAISNAVSNLERYLETKYNETFGKKHGDLESLRISHGDEWLSISLHYRHISGLACEDVFETKLHNHVVLSVWHTENNHASIYPIYPEIKDEIIGFFEHELRDIPEQYK